VQQINICTYIQVYHAAQRYMYKFIYISDWIYGFNYKQAFHNVLTFELMGFLEHHHYLAFESCWFLSHCAKY